MGDVIKQVLVANWRRGLVITAVLTACSVTVVAIVVEHAGQFLPFYVIPVLMAIPLLARHDSACRACRAWCLSVGVGEATVDAFLPVGVFSGMIWYLPSTLLLIAAGLGRTRSVETRDVRPESLGRGVAGLSADTEYDR